MNNESSLQKNRKKKIKKPIVARKSPHHNFMSLLKILKILLASLSEGKITAELRTPSFTYLGIINLFLIKHELIG